LSGEAEGFAKGKELRIIKLPAHETIERYNKLADEGKFVAAIIHIRCWRQAMRAIKSKKIIVSARALKV